MSGDMQSVLDPKIMLSFYNLLFLYVSSLNADIAAINVQT